MNFQLRNPSLPSLLHVNLVLLLMCWQPDAQDSDGTIRPSPDVACHASPRGRGETRLENLTDLLWICLGVTTKCLDVVFSCTALVFLVAVLYGCAFAPLNGETPIFVWLLQELFVHRFWFCPLALHTFDKFDDCVQQILQLSRTMKMVIPPIVVLHVLLSCAPWMLQRVQVVHALSLHTQLLSPEISMNDSHIL